MKAVSKMTDLFDSVNFGDFSLNSRVIRTGMWERETESGFLKSSVFERYEKLAKSGTGLIISEIFTPDPHDRFYEYTTNMNYRGFFKDYRQITDICHEYNVPILGHYAPFYFNDGLNQKVEANDISVDGIRNFQTQVLIAAKKFSFAGFDGIQINMGNNFYLSRFINPYFNQRDDKYGGNTKNRCRIALEVVNALKKNYDLHVNCKLNMEDARKGGMTAEETTEIAKLLEKYGADSIQVTARTITMSQVKDGSHPYINLVNNLVSEVDIPVILGGTLKDSETINGLLNNTNVEFVSMAKPFTAQYDFLTDWKANGSGEAICKSCNNCYTKKESRCLQFNG